MELSPHQRRALDLADGNEAVGVTGAELAEELGIPTRQANVLMGRLAREGLLIETKWARKGGEWTLRAEMKRVPAASIVWLHPRHRRFADEEDD
jgi:hypothetical protein